MNVKITFFFEYLNSAIHYASAALGWTETFYGFSNAITSLDAWLNAEDVLAYIQLRRACLPPGYRIAWLRVADEANPRSFKVKAILAAFGGAKVSGSAGGEPVGLQGQVQCALLVDLVRLPDNNTDHTHHRKFLMRALPVDVINGNIIAEGGQNFVAIRQFLTWLAFDEAGANVAQALPGGIAKNTTIGIRYQNPATATFAPLGNTTNAVNDSRSISVGAVLGAVGQHVTIRHLPDTMREANKIWTIRQVTAGPPPNTILGRAKRDLQPINYAVPGPAEFRVANPVYNLFNEYTIIGLRNKKTGRLFRQLRGRSSNR